MYLADLPGYGYARGGASSVAELARVADSYFGGSVGRVFRPAADAAADGGRVSRPAATAAHYRIAGVLHVLDARHPGLDADLEAAAWLASLGVERAVAANKVDKLSRAERARNLETLERTLGTAALPLSAASGEGLDALWTLIARWARR